MKTMEINLIDSYYKQEFKIDTIDENKFMDLIK